jgi:hypothetical protein
MAFFKPRRQVVDSSTNYQKGLHRGHASGLPGVEPDLTADHIKYGFTMFGILGTMVQWFYDLMKEQAVGYLTVPEPPSIGMQTDEDHSGGAHTSESALTVPDPPTVSNDAENSMLLADDCEVAWSDTVGADITSDVDAVDYKKGSGCVRLTVAAAATVGQLAVTDQIDTLDVRDYNYVKFWIKSSVEVNNQLQMQIDDTAGCVSPIKELNIGALTADTWTEKTLALGDASGMSAIISMSVAMDIDLGAFVLRIDQVRFTKGA